MRTPSRTTRRCSCSSATLCFSSAFPLAALCALINNLIEIRSDAFKLCTGLQRPFGQRVESIGQWQKVMEAMGVLAIVVNCYLIGQCGQLQRLFPWLSPEAAIVSVVVLEHFALLLKYLIHVAIPDIPGWVAEEMAKLEYQRREAFKRHERQAQHRYQQQQRRRREEEERQRHAEHHTRREREAGRDEARAEGSGSDAVNSEKTSAKAKGSGVGSHGQERPKRPGSLLASNNVMKLKQIIPLQGKFLSSGATAGSGGAAAGPTPRPAPAQSSAGTPAYPPSSASSSSSLLRPGGTLSAATHPLRPSTPPSSSPSVGRGPRPTGQVQAARPGRTRPPVVAAVVAAGPRGAGLQRRPRLRSEKRPGPKKKAQVTSFNSGVGMLDAPRVGGWLPQGVA